ncbi:O-acyltransferase like protein-like [Schistocerca piceifrons]|uniref:O-acyltransferase like protein-like n=1 Tax=Schistocerca piceifrons TaxID=274613 RepID=UPI001F5FA34E|nr:O-acyltransferase like protein-like [Schistocerca piceifrons]
MVASALLVAAALAAAAAVAAAADSNIMRVPQPARQAAPAPATAAPPREPADVPALLDAWSPRRLADAWPRRPSLSDACDRHLSAFLRDLRRGHLWALKMSDANGRYSSGIFWGNEYWTGSKAQCDQLNLNITGELPFALGFSSVSLNLSLIGLPGHHPQQVLIGVCLPYSCKSEDIYSVMEFSIRENDADGTERSILVTKVKSPHNLYNMLEDSTFWVLFSVSSVMVIFLAIGTGYDYYWSNMKQKSQLPVLKNDYKYEITTISNGKTPNGKLPDKRKSCQPNVNNNDICRCNRNVSPAAEGADIPVTETKPRQRLGVMQRIILSFSVRLNFNIICDRSVGSDTIPTIHGLRSLSMIWVILGHTCIVAFKYSDNMAYRGVVEREVFFQGINNAAFSVDTFFFISGLLVSFLYFRTISKVDVTRLTRTTGIKSKILEYLGMLAYRYGRLTVPYMFVLGVVEISMKWFYYNSVFEPPTMDHINCPKYWWRNALFINTFYPVQDMCMLWSWYLADDTQFYILGIAILIVAASHFQVAAAMVAMLLMSSWCTTAFIAYTNKHMPSEDDPLALFDKIYDKPWTRLGPYIIGMCVGWLLYKTDCKITMNKFAVICGWLLSITGILALIYGLYNVELHPVTGAAYSSLSHSAWALALGWIVVACSTGYGGIINKILSSTKLYPLSRVTYCAYLVHPLMIRVMAMTTDGPFHLSIVTVLILFSGQVVASYILSFILSLAFEAPIVSLLKLFAPDKSKNPR